MNEGIPSPVEKFPTEGEVMRVMERLFKNGEFIEIERTERDENLLRLVFEGIDVEGDRMLYDYRVVLKEDDDRIEVVAVIDVVFHDKVGTPCGGYNVADYKQGAWELPH